MVLTYICAISSSQSLIVTPTRTMDSQKQHLSNLTQYVETEKKEIIEYKKVEDNLAKILADMKNCPVKPTKKCK